ncbi:MAG: GNAT family N-acetyltransferase [Pseudomonadota bacterium]
MAERLAEALTYTYIDRVESLPAWLTLDGLTESFHHKMKPFHDTLADVRRALEYGLNIDPSKDGGFVITACRGQELVGGILMLRTGMGGYIPSWILLMVFVDPSLRGQGVGRQLIDRAREHCDGDIKLHVEHDNPARRLYERVGFTSKYLEMRLSNP